ncbi:tyrosine-type recombinase/integrase [Paracoccus sp. SCSIO 75233]|uniref:tyrosine-type recombinase/integrase n=1 Tax=Paracoccus sp. SCSIO 75233 TaxID=3017782 RepID=UPI0022F1133F|nr:tyrosine-type recombinase/integrase [Paracoccus sp. SCSIO 75233]WBU54633.1 tyrosine-type recombinase/integrase [Paracoccus sp. SCSIO 75233]
MAGRSKNAGRRLLTLKGNRWWFRREIPEVIRKAVGRGRYWQVNLRTGDLRAAQRMRDELERETAETFAAFRSGEVISPVTLSAREQGVVYREAIAAAEDDQQQGPDDWPGMYDISVESAEATAEAFRKPAEREAFLSALHGYEPVDAHLEAYLRLAKVAPKTRKERAGLIGRMAAWAAGQTPRALTLDRIDRRQAGRYVSEVIDKMHPATQTKHLTALRGYWKYLASRGLIDLPPGEPRGAGWPWNDQQLENKGKRVERDSKEAEERAFTEQEVRTLLHSPDPARMREEHIPAIRDALTISLLSGMRLAEIVSLWVEEIREGPDGVGLVFDIQQGKTDAAPRPVPVHPDLTAIVQRRMVGKTGKAWLFHELEKERDPSDTFGKRFARFRKQLGVDDMQPGKRRSLVNFHSARRWFITQARHEGQPRETIADVVGHVPDKKDMTFGVYTRGASPAQMRACVEAVRLPERQWLSA